MIQSSQQKLKIAQLVLAAGSSSRMGSPKQLLQWGEITLIEHSIQQGLKSNINDVYVVLGSNFDLIHSVISHLPIKILRNEHWSLGMGTSIAVGIKELKKENYDGVLISLVDQPLIDTFHFEVLLEEFKKHKNSIIATCFDDVIGVPAIFGITHFEELSGLNRDIGARYVIKKYIDEVKYVDGTNKIRDIDTLEEYYDLLKKIENLKK